MELEKFYRDYKRKISPPDPSDTRIELSVGDFAICEAIYSHMTGFKLVHR